MTCCSSIASAVASGSAGCSTNTNSPHSRTTRQLDRTRRSHIKAGSARRANTAHRHSERSLPAQVRWGWLREANRSFRHAQGKRATGGCVRGAQALKLVGKRATGGCVRGRGLSPAYKPLPIVLGLLAPTTSRGWDDRDCDRRPKPVTAPATPELEGAVDPPSWQYFRRAGGTGTLSIYRTKVAPPTPARAGPISLRTCRPVDRGSGVRVR